jgi:DNA-directed RNA polymerase subunit RPC12/RpoP
MTKIIHIDTDDIICPYCGHNNEDEKSELEFESSTECENCDKEFDYRMDVSYTNFENVMEGDDIICPDCGYKNTDEKSEAEIEGSTRCKQCKKEFDYRSDFRYTTFKK